MRHKREFRRQTHFGFIKIHRKLLCVFLIYISRLHNVTAHRKQNIFFSIVSVTLNEKKKEYLSGSLEEMNDVKPVVRTQTCVIAAG